MAEKSSAKGKASGKRRAQPRQLGPGDLLKKFHLITQETDPDLQAQADKDDCMYMALVSPTLAAAAGEEITEIPLVSDDEVMEVDYVLANLREKGKLPKKLGLALETPGGLPAPAYKIGRALRQNFEKLTIYVPFSAYSAGTLIAVAADEIVMGQMSNLGPLDVQVPGRDGMYVSGSAFRKAVDWMEEMQKRKGGEATADALLKWIDPIMLRSFEDLQKASEQYLREILQKARYNSSQIQQIVSALVWDLPTHEFAIMRDRAIEMGIRVGLSEDHPEWHLMRDWVMRLAFVASDDHILAYVLPKKRKPQANLH